VSVGGLLGRQGWIENNEKNTHREKVQDQEDQEDQERREKKEKKMGDRKEQDPIKSGKTSRA
jgi:hypothetical protein